MAAITSNPNTGVLDVSYFYPPDPAPAGDVLLIADTREELDEAVAVYRLGADERARRRARNRRQSDSRRRNR